VRLRISKGGPIGPKNLTAVGIRPRSMAIEGTIELPGARLVLRAMLQRQISRHRMLPGPGARIGNITQQKLQIIGHRFASCTRRSRSAKERSTGWRSESVNDPDKLRIDRFAASL